MKTLTTVLAMMICLCLPVPADQTPPGKNIYKFGFPGGGTVAIIPTAANTPGRHGAFYKTRVVIKNLTDIDYGVWLFLYGREGEVSRQVIQLEPREYRSWDNFLEQVFSYRGNGAVIVSAGAFNEMLTDNRQFSLTAEVYTDSPNGRFTTTVVNGILPSSNIVVEEAFHSGITVNEDQRVNIGVFDVDQFSESITARVYDATGAEVQRIDFHGNVWDQKSITVPVDNGYIEWKVSPEVNLSLFLWAVTIDNKSNDGTLVWAATISRGSDGGIFFE